MTVPVSVCISKPHIAAPAGIGKTYLARDVGVDMFCQNVWVRVTVADTEMHKQGSSNSKDVALTVDYLSMNVYLFQRQVYQIGAGSMDDTLIHRRVTDRVDGSPGHGV